MAELKKIGITTNDQDLWVLKEKVQPSVVGKDSTLESICASGICLRRISCIYSSHLYYSKEFSCQFTEYRDKSKFMGNNWNNIETPPGRVAEHLAEIHISYQHIILRASYIMVS